jgi:DNA primase
MVTQEKLEKLGIRVKSRMNSGNFMCWCPLHKDHNPSFAISEETGLWICFACGRKGSWNVLVHELKGDPALLEEAPNERLARLTFPKLEDLAKEDNFTTLWEEPYLDIFEKRISGYLSYRGVDTKVAIAFGLRFDPHKNHIIFPVRDREGTLQGVVRRQVGGRGPKYIIDNFTKSMTLFGIHKVQPDKPVIVLEGLIDVLKAYQFGYNAVALQGTSINSYQVEQLSFVTDEVWVALDNDEAGRREQRNVARRLTGGFRRVYLLRYPPTVKDIGDITDKSVLDQMAQYRVPFTNH